MIGHNEKHNEAPPTQRKSIRLVLRCPSCATSLGSIEGEPIPGLTSIRTCRKCAFLMRNECGIWIALTPERLAYFRRFVKDYERIRAMENRGSASSDYYLGLPFMDTTGANAGQWNIRARTFECFQKEILPGLESRYGSMNILDIGAGNCWLSYRLALRGHRPAAIDLLVNDQDGLGAARHYAGRLALCFPRFQAEMDRLPFADGQFDCAVFNASFHYSPSYQRTLREVIRCLRPGGTVVIADSPWYERVSSGEQMLRERRAMFLERFATASDSIPSCEYLTDSALRELAQTFELSWTIHHPAYGLRWRLRPVIARLRRRREPSRFRIYVAKVQK